MEHILIVNVHFLNAVSDDGGQFVGEGRVPRPNGWIGVRHQQRVAVLMLQAFAVERGSPRGGPHQEASSPLVGSGPNQVRDALEAEHGVERVERNGGVEVSGVGRG